MQVNFDDRETIGIALHCNWASNNCLPPCSPDGAGEDARLYHTLQLHLNLYIRIPKVLLKVPQEGKRARRKAFVPEDSIGISIG